MARPVGASVPVASATDRHQGQGGKAGGHGAELYYLRFAGVGPLRH